MSVRVRVRGRLGWRRTPGAARRTNAMPRRGRAWPPEEAEAEPAAAATATGTTVGAGMATTAALPAAAAGGGGAGGRDRGRGRGGHGRQGGGRVLHVIGDVLGVGVFPLLLQQLRLAVDVVAEERVHEEGEVERGGREVSGEEERVDAPCASPGSRRSGRRDPASASAAGCPRSAWAARRRRSSGSAASPRATRAADVDRRGRPGRRARPVSISNRIAPTAKMSDRVSPDAARRLLGGEVQRSSSGGRPPRAAGWASSRTRAVRTSPSYETITLPGVTRPWK